MKTCVFILLLISLFACTKQEASKKTTISVDVAVYATHAKDTTKIVSTDTVQLKLQ